VTYAVATPAPSSTLDEETHPFASRPRSLLRVRVHALERVVVQKLLDEVDVAHQHASAAVPVQVERVQGVALAVVRLEKVQVRVPLVSDHLDDAGRGPRSRSDEVAGSNAGGGRTDATREREADVRRVARAMTERGVAVAVDRRRRTARADLRTSAAFRAGALARRKRFIHSPRAARDRSPARSRSSTAIDGREAGVARVPCRT